MNDFIDFNPGSIIGAHVVDHTLDVEPTSIVTHVASVAAGAMIGSAVFSGMRAAGNWVAGLMHERCEPHADEERAL